MASADVTLYPKVPGTIISLVLGLPIDPPETGHGDKKGKNPYR